MFLVSICRRGIVGVIVELRHLRYFVAVAEAENVLRAATQKLHVSQPAVSRQIRDLEDELGVELFERTGKAVALTDAGRVFLREARAVLERTNEAVRNVRDFADAGEAELHVGYSPTPSGQVLSATMRAFQKAMPNVHVKLHDWSNEEIAVGLRDGRLKVALIARALKRGPFRDFRFEELLREHVRLAVPPNHPFAQRRSVSLAVAAEALGYTFGNRVKLVRLTPEPKPISFGIAARKGRLSPATEKFWQCARDAAASIPVFSKK